MGSESFPEFYRLKHSKEIRAVLKTGERVFLEKYILLWKENDLGHPRAAFIASRKVGNAVVRNRVKRLLREVFRRCGKELGGRDLVFIGTSRTRNAGYHECRSAFEKYVGSI